MTVRDVRLELLRPREIDAALHQRSLVYVPLGTVEWHCHHLPVGLDALNAHGVCVAAAERSGGVVYPTLYFGTGGDHGEYPWTVMLPTADHLVAIIEFALHRLDALGVQRVVLFSGHFADEQLAMIADIAARWNDSGRASKVLATSINRAEGLPIAPDHAGVFETTMLSALHPDCVDLDELEPLGHGPLDDDWDPARHDPSHPLWGVIGADPRTYDPSLAADVLDRTAGWLAGFATA